MITLTPLEDEFCQKNYTIYAVNKPNNNGSSVTTFEVCPHCKARNIFRFYESENEYETSESHVKIYDCRCPNCNKNFEVKIEDYNEE
jgi:hypothetical protein